MAKFKVGDKVRVREDLAIDRDYDGVDFVDGMEAFKGKILKITSIEDYAYNVEENGWYWTDKMLEEIKEDKMEKTFRELIIDGIKPGEIWESKDQRVSRIYLNEYGNLQLEGEDSSFAQNYSTCIGLKATYELKRKEYTFEEAFKSYEEGKEIESKISNVKFKKQRCIDDDMVDFYWADDNKVWYKFLGFDLELIRGKWYIND